ncbi:DUF1259 domain-containing protein [Streptomyces sp. NPDC046197]|uniref:DUF1259 domain-containing protein n=1 Tax=Streptomyces sp. NPDC046197 TaxID=3154337 RepID=UPI00340B88C4
MTDENRQQNSRPGADGTRRRVLTAAALAPVLAGASGVARAQSTEASTARGPRRVPVPPVQTALADWRDVGAVLGRPGDLKRNVMYHTGLPRRDLRVVSRGVVVEPALALGSHVSFVRYADGGTMLMGDVVVTEDELQTFSDVLYEHGIAQTAIHKHLLSQKPDIWWVHVHAHGHDPLVLARGLRAAFDRTGTPPPAPAAQPRPGALDTAGIDAAMGVKGVFDERIYKSTFVRRETVTDGARVLPPGLGATTAINFQPLGGGRAAVSGDCALIAGEVQVALMALRRSGAQLVELHSHGLTDEPRLFFVHFWAVGDAVRLARGLRTAVNATDVVPMAGAAGG